MRKTGGSLAGSVSVVFARAGERKTAPGSGSFSVLAHHRCTLSKAKAPAHHLCRAMARTPKDEERAAKRAKAGAPTPGEAQALAEAPAKAAAAAAASSKAAPPKATAPIFPATSAPSTCLDAVGQGPPAKPVVPADDAEHVNVLALMRSLIKYVQYRLKDRIAEQETGAFAGFGPVDLHAHRPLDIRAQAADTDLLSYKAPWNNESARAALAGTHMYEAGGSLFWMSPFPQGDERTKIAGDTPSWSTVVATAVAFRPDDIKTFEANEVEGAARSKRILFPGVMSVHAPTLDSFLAEAFPGNLDVLTGHAAIYAWYLAMYDALEGGHTLWMASLFQAALTVTVRAHVCASTPELAALSIRCASEGSAVAQYTADSFPSFARKLRLALNVPGLDTIAKRLEQCHAKGLRFNGTKLYRNLLVAAMQYVERTDDETHALLLQLEASHGREVLTGKFNNLNRLIQLCGKEYDSAPKMWGGASTPALIRQVLHYVIFCLKEKEMAGSAVTVEWLDKSRDGTPGACHRTLAKVQLVMHIHSLLEGLPAHASARKEAPQVMAPFATYATYTATFKKSPVMDSETAAEDPFVTLRKTLCKAGQTILDFLFDVFEGSHDKDLNSLCKAHTGAIGLLRWDALEGEAGKAWREVSRALTVHQQTVSLDVGAAPPPASGRALQRAMSACTDDGVEDTREKEIALERQETWKQAQQTRRRHARCSVCKFQKVEDLQRWFEQQRTAYEHSGKQNEAQRLFVFSADTFGAECREPWTQTKACKESELNIKKKGV